ncbi:MAG: type I 3-dehydroquinate dehydratase [Chlamydiales bacterium]
MLCAPIRTDSLKAVKLANAKADLIELRLDLFTPKNLRVLRSACQKPVIFKLSRFDPSILSFDPDMIDLPFGVEIDLPLPRICSYHDQERTPDLEHLYKKIKAYKADYYKIVTYARSTSDSLRMLELMKKTGVIGLCMGEMGKITRILAPIFGAPWNYAPLSLSQVTADGQLLLDELLSTYHYHTLSKNTGVYGLIGDPISKSVGDRIHNFAFHQLGLNAVYIKMRVKKHECSDVLLLCEKIGFKGLSVTMPLKELVRKNQAINTVVFSKKKPRYFNSDGLGALRVLEKTIPLKGKRMVILGAGGTAIAIADEAKKRGIDVWIANRNLARARRITPNVLTLETFASKGYDILINCTPVCPVSTKQLIKQRIVMDTMISPKMTRLLQAAQKKDCLLIYGLDMFIQQAVDQYCFWFEVD